MVFAGLTFLYLFLPAGMALYHLRPSLQYRNAVLAGLSLCFYAWGEPVWVVLLIFSSVTDYWHGIIIEKHRGRLAAKLAIVSSLVLNLGLLGLFKYSGFFVENLNALLGLSLAVPSFSLPIGISFYSFQTLSYVIDVYRGEVGAQRSFISFLMFVSMFPQLVAGPIVRYSHIAQEIEHRTFSLEEVSAGLTRFCQGLAKKVLLANHAGMLAGRYLDGNLDKLSTPGAWFGILMFTLQIYYDFSGYSDMAIGLGRMLGFHFMENFDHPYISRSVSEFWRRWHISLGSFFRDYVYIPLGGNRRHLVRNLLVVWGLTGLWHGASWNFILWGLYFGVLILIERLFLQRVLARLSWGLPNLYLMTAVVFGWVLFYFTDMTRLTRFWGILFGGGVAGPDISLGILIANNLLWLVFAVLFCLPVGRLARPLLGRLSPGGSAAVQWAAVGLNLAVLLVCTALLTGQSYNPFLYFRF